MPWIFYLPGISSGLMGALRGGPSAGICEDDLARRRGLVVQLGETVTLAERIDRSGR